jgi:hypothetical protein
MVRDCQFPAGTNFGNAGSTVGVTVGGSAGDWIVNELGIPAVEPEIGPWEELDNWIPKTPKYAFTISNEFFPMLKYAASKIGNEITVEQKGFYVD